GAQRQRLGSSGAAASPNRRSRRLRAASCDTSPASAGKSLGRRGAMIDACVADVVRRQARDRPDEVALWFEGRETTYAELDRLSSQCAQALIAAGVEPGERVGVLAKGADLFFVLWFAALKAGACLNPVNWRLAPPEIAFILKDAG